MIFFRMMFDYVHSFTLENRRLGTIINSIARSFEKDSYLNEVNFFHWKKIRLIY